MRDGELGVVRVVATKGCAVSGSGVGGSQRQTIALAKAGVHVDRAFVLAKLSTRQGDRHITPVVAAAAARCRIGQRATSRLLHCPGQTALDADAIECVQFFSGSLQGLLLCLNGLEARCEFRLVLADAVALQCAAQLRVLRLEAFDALDQRLDLRHECVVVRSHRAQRCNTQAQGNGQRRTGGQSGSHVQYPPFLPMPA